MGMNTLLNRPFYSDTMVDADWKKVAATQISQGGFWFKRRFHQRECLVGLHSQGERKRPV
jgi:hypothetical protein